MSPQITHKTDVGGVLVDEIGQTMLARYPEEVTDLGLSERLGLDDRELNDLSHEYRSETAMMRYLRRLSDRDIESLAAEAGLPLSRKSVPSRFDVAS